MNCQDLRDLLEDGSSDTAAEQAVREHLASCRACREASAGLRAEERLMAKYAADLDQGWDVDGLRMRLRGRLGCERKEAVYGSWKWTALPGPHWIRPLAVAATLFLLVGGMTWIYWPQTRGAPSGESRSSAGGSEEMASHGSPSGDRSLEGALSAIRRAEREYVSAIEALEQVVAARTPAVDPGLRAEIRKNLSEIDERIEATRKAYYARPADPDLAMFMLAAYGKKVELLYALLT